MIVWMNFFFHSGFITKVFYKTIKQILETILKTNSDAFREAVLIEYPRKGLWVIGFTTGDVIYWFYKDVNGSVYQIETSPADVFLLNFTLKVVPVSVTASNSAGSN